MCMNGVHQNVKILTLQKVKRVRNVNESPPTHTPILDDAMCLKVSMAQVFRRNVEITG